MSIFDNGLDDFWDIEKLVPKKKPTAAPFVTKSPVREHTVDGESPQNSPDEQKLTITPRTNAITERSSYFYAHSSLIGNVTIIRDIDKYDFYENFRKAALIYYDFKTEKCDFAKYYSYMPQYSQLTMEQKNYYFYWRSEVRRGKYPRCDYSYLYLYVYEILNLPDKVVPEEGIVILCNLWREYRRTLPKIDAYFASWIPDYCLVHDQRVPIEILRDFIYEIVSVTDFPEFYLSDFELTGVLGTESMLLYLSNYDWRRGKFAAGEHAELYREHMIGAMSKLFADIFFGGVSASGEHRTLSRVAFARSLCTHAVKCRLEVEYTPLSRDERLRSGVTEAVRYTENKLRALLGVKSRLGIKALSERYKNIIDAYFAPVINAEKQKKTPHIVPEYEKLYDAPREALSFADADELELASWTTTARLVAEESDAEYVHKVEEPKIEEPKTQVEPVAEPACEADTYGLTMDEILQISDIFDGRTIDDSTAERINEAFADGFGDIILEFDGEKYTVIDDYREEICAWLAKIMK